MDLRIFAEEIQNFIRKVNAKRNQSGILDYDTCQSVLECAAETQSDAIFGIGYYYFAEYYMNLADASQAMHCLAECAQCFRNTDLFEYLPRVYNMMGVVSEYTGNRLIALSYFYSCLQYAEIYKDAYAHAMADSNVGYILLRMRQYTEAKEHYYRSISDYEKAEYTIFSNRNVVECMMYAGICHLLLVELEEASALLEQLKATLRKEPGCKHPPLGVAVLEAGCEHMRGNRKRSREIVAALEEEFYKEENQQELQEIIVIVADLLDSIKDKKRMERLLLLMDERYIEDNPMVYFDMYPFKSQYLLRQELVNEYEEYTRRYLCLYQQRLEDGRKLTAQILELQDKLSRVELEQKNIRDYNRKLESIALYDSLTGLANRTYLNEYFSQKFEEAYEKGTLLGVELMDIDHFKAYNDTYGHLQGDICIEAVGKILRAVQSDKVFCARYGGDEFMIVYSQMSVKEIQAVAEQIQRKIRELTIEHKGAGPGEHITVTQGIFARVPDAENREWDFNSMADSVLYAAKREGRNRYRIVTEFEE